MSFELGPEQDTRIHFITDTTLAYFPKERIDKLLEDPGFLAVSYRNLEELYAHLVAYFLGMNSDSAYESVRYALQFCRQNGFGPLTHEQMALLTGHSRTTVTAIMHEIALAEPELLQ